MQRRNNPWPSFVDLFSALFIVTFAGLVLFSGVGKGVRADAVKIRESVTGFLKDRPDIAKYIHVRGEDICIEMYIVFAIDKDSIAKKEDIDELRQIAKSIKMAIDSLPSKKREAVEIVIEGHTDNQQLNNNFDSRTRFLYNWQLSSRRASSVLYEFTRVGLSAPKYKIAAIGYADTDPLCNDRTQEGLKKNRRTTLRVRVDTRKL